MPRKAMKCIVEFDVHTVCFVALNFLQFSLGC